jgi:hypothetical protein
VAILRALLFVAALLTPPVSTTLAHVDPPDPPWVGGYWDDDDFDSAVDAILQVAAVAPEPSAGADPIRWVSVGRVERLDVGLVAPKKTRTTESPRSPPVRLLPSSSS